MNRYKNLQDFVANARHGDTHTTVREHIKRVETYTATTDDAIRDTRRAVLLTVTAVVAGADMYETRQTTGDLVLDTTSIPGEVLDGVVGDVPRLLQGIRRMTAPFTVDTLMEEHQQHLPAL